MRLSKRRLAILELEVHMSIISERMSLGHRVKTHPIEAVRIGAALLIGVGLGWLLVVQRRTARPDT
jgi:hypothetical protein